ncbi:unnamed protein product [Prorocentrum cordatum]|uniref:WD repeat-containing protein 92 n=1 Tax=Prorocentrum cordatum TaxID=2364126 RepID=A0ABN9SVE5_9DINO|nr:unnamed protein product [Polarella glacialis]
MDEIAWGENCNALISGGRGVGGDPSEGETPADCWTVAFGNSYNDSERCIAAGYDNGDVKLFDLRTMTLRWDTNVRNGVCHLQFDRKDIRMNKLGVSTLESTLCVYDLRTYHPTEARKPPPQPPPASLPWRSRPPPFSSEHGVRAHATVPPPSWAARAALWGSAG